MSLTVAGQNGVDDFFSPQVHILETVYQSLWYHRELTRCQFPRAYQTM